MPLLALLAVLVSPALPDVAPHHLAVLDEQERPRTVPEPGVPTLVLPIFTRCGGTCPLTALALAQAGEVPELRVVLLSFDSEDTAEDLRDFRGRLQLPSGWVLARAPDPAALRGFLDELEFHFMKTDAGFAHPNQAFVLSPRGVWAATFEGAPASQRELRAALGRALDADAPGALRRLRQWLLRPEALIALSCLGLAAALAAALHLGRKAAVR